MNGASLLDRVRPLLPAIRERAPETEAARRVSEATVKELLESGVFRALQPARWGGLEAEPLAFYEAVAEIGTVCASTAWCLGVVGVHDWQLALFAEEAQDAVWRDDPATRISSSYAPTGCVTAVDGGYRLAGTWSFSSGCDFCQWVFLGGVLPRDGGIEMRTFLLPRRDYRIDDNWHVMGLAGSGSKNIVVEDAFVPEAFSHSFAEAFAGRSPGQASNPGPLYRLPFGCVFAGALVGPALGAARGAVEEALRQVVGRVSAGDGRKAGEDPAVLARFSEAANLVDAAWEAQAAVWRELQATARRGEPMPLPLRARSRSVGAQAVEWAVQATLRVFQAAGSRAIFTDNPLQRAFRDVMAARAHFINNVDRSGPLRARGELGALGGEFFL
jgi:3-hydroxy-9,10-secoandrosta-1,3,5(10)-triene-9,17-dione monooxygenase